MQIYNTTTNTWSQGAALPGARGGPAVVAYNNRIYIISGYTTPFPTGTDTVYIYDPATNTYSNGAVMPGITGNVPGALLNNEIYVVGGGAPPAHYAYNPATNTWRTIANILTATCQASTAFAWNGEIWMVGCLGLAMNQQVQVYNPGTDTWRFGTSYNQDHQGAGSALFQGRPFVVGGGAAAGGSTVVESLQPCGTPTLTPIGGTPTRTGTAPPASATRTATPTVCPFQPPWVAGPTVTTARYAFQAALPGDNKLYIAGGQTGNNTPVPDVARYNPVSNAWEAVPPLPVAAGQVAVGADATRVFVAGGWVGGTIVTTTLQIYTLASNSWSFGASMPAGVEAAAGTVLNGKFYVIGGDDFSLAVRSTYIYDIATNTWSTGPQIPDTNGRTNTYATSANGKVYVFGGVYISGTTNVTIDTMLAYDPVANAWTTLASAGTGTLGNYGGVSPYGPGKLLVTDGGSGTFTASNSTHIYDIASNTYTVGPPMTNARMAHAQGTLPDGRVLVASGLQTGTTTTNTVELLGPQVQCGTATPTPPGATSTATRTVTVVVPPITATRTGVAASPTRTAGPATATATVCTIQFTDVDPGNPFYTFIRCLACRGIVSGYADGTFRWGADVTRGQLSKIIAGSAGLTNTVPSTQQTFADVPNSNVFWVFIERLQAVGAISGYTCGGPGEPCDPQSRPYFRWGNNATRGQIAKIDAIAANYNDPIPTTQQTFADVPNTNVFWLFIEELASRNIISGYTCGGPGEPCDPQSRPYFRWFANATRGQMSKIAAQTFFPNCSTPARR